MRTAIIRAANITYTIKNAVFENETLLIDFDAPSTINLINVTTVSTPVMKLDVDRDLGYYEVNFINCIFSQIMFSFKTTERGMSNPQITFDNSKFQRYMNRSALKLDSNNQTWTANMTINGGMFEDNRNNDDSGYLFQFFGANYNNVRNKILFDDVFLRKQCCRK